MGLALLQFAVTMAFNGNYGYFRDELYYIACSNHLAFGYVDQPPLSIFILKLNRLVLGDSIHALRFLPALAGAVVVVLAAWMARRLGGGRFAQGLAAFSVVAAHALLGAGKIYSMNPFDVVFWALAICVLLEILDGEKPRLWLLFGLIVGLGLENKYSMGFMVMGVVAGLLLTRQRKHLASWWFWAGAAVAALVFLPHVIWEIATGFPSLEFMRNASQMKNVHLGPWNFLMGQIRDVNMFNAPLWMAGIYFLFRHKDGAFRPVAWMYPVVFCIMVATGAKVYYLSPIYPVLLAGGSVLFEQLVQRRPLRWLKPVFVTLLLLVGLVALPLVLPVLPVEELIAYEQRSGQQPRAEEQSRVAELPQYYADQFGWREFVDSIAVAYAKLTAEEQAKCFIFVRNYGEAGAIDFFGAQYWLPPARCAHNNYWLWGPGERTGDVAIILGNSRTLEDNLADLKRRYRSVELASTTNAKYCMPYENGRLIFICRGMNTSFQALWPTEKFFI